MATKRIFWGLFFTILLCQSLCFFKKKLIKDLKTPKFPHRYQWEMPGAP